MQDRVHNEHICDPRICEPCWLQYLTVYMTTIGHKDRAEYEVNSGRLEVVAICTSQIMHRCWLAFILSDPIPRRSLHYSSPSPTAGITFMKNTEAGKTKVL
jgi:hypothetical protein